MAGFLRRKTKNLHHGPDPVPAVAADNSSNSASTPLFARFATTFGSTERQSRNVARTSLHSRVVSQPMALGSSPQRAVTTSRPSVVRGRSQHQEVPGNATHGHPQNAHVAHSHPNVWNSDTQLTRVPSPAGIVPQGQTERTVHRVPANYDKPLPIPVPKDDDPSASTGPQDGQTSMFQQVSAPRPLTPLHDLRPSQSAAPPPSAFETRPQLAQRSRSVSVDVPQQVLQDPIFDQETPVAMFPLDSGILHQSSLYRHKHDMLSMPPPPHTYAKPSSVSSRSVRDERAFQSLAHTAKQPRAGSMQMYSGQTDDSAPPRTAATTSGPTASAYVLRKDASTPEPKPDTHGEAVPLRSQSNSHYNASSIHINANSLGNTVTTNGTGIKALSCRPKSRESSNAYADASEELEQAIPALGAGELSPEFGLNRDNSTKSQPDRASSPNFDNLQVEHNSSLAPQSPPFLSHKDYSVARGSDTNMGVAISFPDTQDSLPASKNEPRTKHLPSSSTDGRRTFNGYQNQDMYQSLDPYQEFDRMPHLIHSTAPVRGKPLIFAAMEANIDQQQEQKVSVRVWDGQRHSLARDMGGYISPTPSTIVQDSKRAKLTNSAPHNVISGHPSPLCTESARPRSGYQELPQTFPSVSGLVSPKPRKLSKARNPSVDSRRASRPLTPVKTRPLTPVSPGSPPAKKAGTTYGLSPSIQLQVSLDNQEPHLQVPRSRRGTRTSGMALLGVDEDPFAKTEGVTLLASLATKEKEAKEKEKEQEKDKEARRAKLRNADMSQEWLEEGSVQLKKQPSTEVDGDGMLLINSAKTDVKFEQSYKSNEKRISRAEEFEAIRRNNDVEARLASAISLEDCLKPQLKRDIGVMDTVYQSSSRRRAKRFPFDLMDFLSDARLLSELLSYLSFYDWCILASVSKCSRTTLGDREGLREVVLERFLKTVGYTKWCWDGPDPLPLSLQDLNDYMFGVSTPTYEYARVADIYVKSLTLHLAQRDPALYDMVGRMTAATRAYSRVVLRLRAQAEKDVASRHVYSSSVPGRGAYSRPASRASSPGQSSFSHGGQSQYGNGSSHPTSVPATPSMGFRSPLFRLKRAPLLRVFVPSPDGDWLSDKSVLECEAECQRAGVMDMIRFGDVVWDMAVGDEGNIGRLVWDGSYLIDLDYSYSPVGDLPKYVPALAFPPSYFHKVIRTGPTTSNPIVHIDLCPWGEEIASNLQLLQDRVRTETPQGAFHNVVRWVHRSSFVIRPPSNSVRARGSPTRSQGHGSPRIPIPDAHGLFVDSGWYGTIIIETEGTNESLADLQDRCGPGAFPPRAKGVAGQMGINPAADARKVFRIVRERSRPGEIWVKAVSIKEKLF